MSRIEAALYCIEAITMKALSFILLCFLLPSTAIASEPWRHIRTIGMIQMVVVDKAQYKNQDIYRLAIGKLCAGKNFCYVLFWSDEKLIPTKMPMTDAQAKAMVANWTYNGNTGHRQLLWSCSIVNDPTQCFR
ncbi:MAG: hypothetical protein HY936_05275 [Nitrosomonadales bacterium]|nr:hypothetical protein [Nitrosomonadales bacterium]